MKISNGLIISVCLLITAVSLMISVSAVAAQLQSDRKAMSKSFGELAGDMVSICSDNDLGLCPDGYSLFGKFLNKGTTIIISEHFVADKRYVILAETGNLQSAVKLTVTDSSGKEIKTETGDAGFCGIAFIVPTDGTYRVELSLTECASEQFCSMMLLVEGGNKLTAAEITAAVKNYTSVIEELESDEDFSTIGATRMSGMWSVMATVLEQGQSRRISGSGTTAGCHHFIAVSNDATAKIGMKITDAEKTVVDPGKDDGYAYAMFHKEEASNSSKEFQLTLDLKKSGGTRLVLAGILDDDECLGIDFSFD